MDEDLGILAYDAYCAAVGHTTWDGRQTPDWVELGERIQGAWIAAAEAVRGEAS